MIGRTTSVSERLLEEIARATDTAPEDLPVLYNKVDADALDSLVEDLENGKITFEYAGYEVVIDSDEVITIEGPPTKCDSSGPGYRDTTD